MQVDSIDYMYMTEEATKKDRDIEEEEAGMPTLVVKGRETKLAWASVVPRKGVEAYSVTELGKAIGRLGL